MRRLFAIMVMFGALSGCATLAEKERLARLDDTLRAYERAMEWSEFPRALQLFRAEEGQAPPAPGSFQNIKVTEYRPGGSNMSPDGLTMTRNVQIRYLIMTRMSEHSTSTEEEWKYAESEKAWFLRNGWPDFRR